MKNDPATPLRPVGRSILYRAKTVSLNAFASGGKVAPPISSRQPFMDINMLQSESPSSRSGKKILSFNLLDMPTVSHNNYGLWRHPHNRKRYNDLKYWTDFAQSCERAMFDTLFFADVLGVAAGYGGNNDISIREGMHVPLSDPLMAISAMAAVTRHLGFAATVSTTYEAPFAHARRMSTLDHLTGGRIGWNVVTSYLPNANENFGVSPDKYTHDERYELAEEFMAVCYKLWEGSWADDAVLRDTANGIYANPAKVRRIEHSGPYFQVAGPHLVEPSPQRTPVILQAGSSGRGKEFAAKHAEVVFIGGRSAEAYRQNAVDVRAEVVRQGRTATDVKILAEMGLIVAPTQAEADAKFEDFQAMSSADGYLAHHFGSGADLLKYDRSKTIEEIAAEGGPGSGFLSRYTYPPGTTVGRVIDQATRLDSSRSLFTCGTPERVADKVEEWAETLSVDGFLMRQMISPRSVDDFADLLVPEMQKRGIYRERYEAVTLRENMFGTETPRVRPTHPAAAFAFPTS